MLNLEDFTYVEKIPFPPQGNTKPPHFTPSHTLAHTFKFKTYAPKVFARIREFFNVDSLSYMGSVCGDSNYVEFISNSKSGQFFFYSHDGRYMIKTQTKEENKFMMRILPHYYKFITENPHTLLVKILGMHRVKMYHLNQKIHFVIMGSVFDTPAVIHQMYDLKGSLVGREATAKERANGGVLKDMDLINDKVKMHLGQKKKQFIEQLTRDARFLASLNIMDYSLLVGIHDREKRTSIIAMTDQEKASAALDAVSPESVGSRQKRSSATSGKRRRSTTAGRLVAAFGDKQRGVSEPALGHNLSDLPSMPPMAPASRSVETVSNTVTVTVAAVGPSDEGVDPSTGMVIRRMRSGTEHSGGSNNNEEEGNEDELLLLGEDGDPDEEYDDDDEGDSDLGIDEDGVARTLYPMQGGANGAAAVVATSSAAAAAQVDEDSSAEISVKPAAVATSKHASSTVSPFMPRILTSLRNFVASFEVDDGSRETSAVPVDEPYFGAPPEEAQRVSRIFRSPDVLMDLSVHLAQAEESNKEVFGPGETVHHPWTTRTDLGINSRDTNGQRGTYIYFVGIIDILQQYNSFKRMETIAKSMTHDSKQISSVNADYYAERFIKFFEDNID
jgi:hypothetical protein